MKIWVELSAKEVKEIMRFSGEKEKGPAIRKFLMAELALRRRREISQKVLSGKWGASLPTIEELRKDRDVWNQ